MTEALAIFSAIVAIVALLIAGKSAISAEKSAAAAEKANGLSGESLALQRAEAEAQAEERRRQLRTRLFVDGWSGEGGLVVTNQGPGGARDILVVLTSPPRHAYFPGLGRGAQKERLRIRDTNGWPENFDLGAKPPGRGGNPDVAFVQWTNEDGSRDETGWVQAPAI